jgi:hypothetical protein
VACGTWIGVPPVTIPFGIDVQLLAVRFVDPGHPGQEKGPKYRVTFRNNASVPLKRAFNVLLMAGNTPEPRTDLPQAGVRIESMMPGEIQSVDIRLPFVANRMGRDLEGREVPFSMLHVLVDSHREVLEQFEANNGAILARQEVLPVDPSLFGVDSMGDSVAKVINLAGEGLGPEPGQVLVNVNGMEFQAEILGWYDLGIQAKLPDVPLAGAVHAEVFVVRGDGAASNPMPVELGPATSQLDAPLPPPGS